MERKQRFDGRGLGGQGNRSSRDGTGEGNGTPLQYSWLENPMDGGAWWAADHGVAESGTTERLHFHFSLSCIGEGNGNLLQCSCLENPRDRGAWWAAVYEVAQSWTWLKRLSSSSSSSRGGTVAVLNRIIREGLTKRVYLSKDPK